MSASPLPYLVGVDELFRQNARKTVRLKFSSSPRATIPSGSCSRSRFSSASTQHPSLPPGGGLPTMIHHAGHRSDNNVMNAAWQSKCSKSLSSSGNKLVAVPPPEALAEGIYIGEGYVIHLTRTGVEETSLHCFQQEGGNLYSLRLYAYGRPQLGYWLTRWGTCTTLPETKLPLEVVNKARELHEHDSFGKYDLINNNCEHFASFCRTGIRASAQTALVSACLQKISEVKGWFMKLLQVKGMKLQFCISTFELEWAERDMRMCTEEELR